MSAVETGRVGLGSPAAARVRTFRLLAFVIGAALVAYALGAVLGAPAGILSALFSVFTTPLPLVAWWAYLRAPAELRQTFFLLAWAATLWLVGVVAWYGYYFAGGSVMPEPPGPWDIPLVLARLLVIVAIVVALRSLISFRIALLDAWVVSAATVAIGAAFVWRALEQDVSARGLITLNRPLLSIVTLALLVSAALGSWQGLPLSIVLMGVGEVALTIGSLIYSFHAVQEAYVDSRWADLAWATGAGISILAASTVILGLDRRVSVVSPTRIPRHPAGSRTVLLFSLGALLATLGVACYGLLESSSTLALVGVVAAVSIGAAMAVRARDSIRAVEVAYTRLDKALADAERHQDELAAANAELARGNAQMQAMHVAFADLLNLADERTEGRMRELIEDTGGELADLLEEQLDARRGRD